VITWLTGACSCHCGPASCGNIVSHITSSGIDQNSKFEAWFLLNAFSPSESGKILSQAIVSQGASVLYIGLLLVLNEKIHGEALNLLPGI